jgi:hypothetical protein
MMRRTRLTVKGDMTPLRGTEGAIRETMERKVGTLFQRNPFDRDSRKREVRGLHDDTEYRVLVPRGIAEWACIFGQGEILVMDGVPDTPHGDTKLNTGEAIADAALKR